MKNDRDRNRETSPTTHSLGALVRPRIGWWHEDLPGDSTFSG